MMDMYAPRVYVARDCVGLVLDGEDLTYALDGRINYLSCQVILIPNVDCALINAVEYGDVRNDADLLIEA